MLFGVILMPFLLICKVHTKMENTGSLNSGPEKATSELPICKSPNELKFYGELFSNK